MIVRQFRAAFDAALLRFARPYFLEGLMRILFWGTPEFAVPSLRALQEEGHAVLAVVTQPDRPAGRGRADSTRAP